MPNTRQATEIAFESMARCGALVRPAMRAAVDTLDPALVEMAEFALGWRDACGAPARGGGKGLRPALVLLGAEAAGAPDEAALPGAVAVELVHAFSLVHDDIMDGDERRRHRPSLWKAYGTGPAVMTGDALLALALDVLGRERCAAAVGLLAEALLDVVGGQAADAAFESRPWTGPDAVTVEEYHAMAVRKTGALLGCSAAMGAVLAGAPPGLAAGLARAGCELGLAFQAVDDVLGIWGDPAVTGKPVFSDLRRHKKTVPVLAALAGPRCDDRLVELLTGAPADEELREAAFRIERAGGRAITEEMARDRLESATGRLRALPLSGRAAAELLAVAACVVDRHR
ncbi:polyprenyl synthetase family protein [Actinomadura napierensis]|uniref:Family 2 encapsulin nanocompartment cargo protein polyprenyl transferase n=1 Tax=Actinomadura napierensis TaxID=267854 RepID=A0ABP5JZZ2_9ACTN